MTEPLSRQLTRRQAVVVGLSVVMLAACGAPGPDSQRLDTRDDDVRAVQIWHVEPRELRVRRQWTGQLKPLRTVTIHAPAHGEIERLQVREGDRVERGDLLVEVANADLRARRDILQKRESQLQAQLERWEALADRQAAGAADVTDALVRLLEVQEMLAGISATLLTHAVHAPVSGWVSQTMVDPTAPVSEGQALLAIEDERSIGVRLTVSTFETAFLESYSHLSVTDDSDRTLSLERVVWGQEEPRGFTTVELYLNGVRDNRRRALDIVYERHDETLVVPWTAVARSDDMTWVAVVGGTEPGVLERRKVSLGRAHPDGVEVIAGLEREDRVVRYEPRAHPDGQRVRPVDRSSR